MFRTLIIFGICATLCFSVVVNIYYSIDAKFFSLIADQPNSKQLSVNIGDPDEILDSENILVNRGWKLPKHIPKGTSEIWIYDVFTGRRFYLFMDKNGQMIGHFSSSS
jgi:hypothetical protein